MDFNRQSIVMTMALALVLVLAAFPASAAEARGDAMTAVSVLGDQVAWTPSGGATRFALRVAGPETDLEQRFENGSAPVFSLFDEQGNARADGSYTWELREESAPVNSRVRDPKNGRDLASHDSQERIEVSGGFQWGSFTIENGAVVDSSLVEVQVARPAKD